jgi:hypothetical protein
MSGKERYSDIVAACVKILGQITKGLWCVAAAVEEQDSVATSTVTEIDLTCAGDHTVMTELGTSNHVVAQSQSAATRVRDCQDKEHRENTQRRYEHVA